MKTFYLVHDQARSNALEYVRESEPGSVVRVGPPIRNLEQNAKFHAICRDLARSQLKWAGKRRNLHEWKALLVSGHSMATEQGGEVIPGIEGEFVAIRESTSTMSKKRSSSLIEYAQAFCAEHEVNAPTTREL